MLSPVHLSIGGLTQCTPLWNRDWHHESQHKIYVPKSGSAWYDCGSGDIHMVPGKIYLIPGGRRHRNRCPRHFAVWWTHLHAVDAQVAAAVMQQSQIRLWSTVGRQPVWQLFEHFFPARRATSELRILSLFADLFADLFAEIVVDQPSERAAIVRLQARLAPAAAWLDANACKNPPLSAAAKMAGMGPAHFHRLAVTAWGETPHARVQRVRLERVRDLLSTSTASITELADLCGFGNPFYLARAFRLRYGESPSHVRARARLSVP